MILHLYNLQEWKLYQEFLNLWIHRFASFYMILFIALMVCNMVIGYLEDKDDELKNIDGWLLLLLISFVMSIIIEVAIFVLVPLAILLALPIVTGITIIIPWLYLRGYDNER